MHLSKPHFQFLKRIDVRIIAGTILMLMLPLPLLAQAACTSKICNPLGEGRTNLAEIVGFFIQTILPITGAVALLMFIVGAIFWIISGGNAEQVTKGKDTVVWAALGSIVILGSYVALSFIFKILTAGVPGYAPTERPPAQGPP